MFKFLLGVIVGSFVMISFPQWKDTVNSMFNDVTFKESTFEVTIPLLTLKENK